MRLIFEENRHFLEEFKSGESVSAILLVVVVLV